MRFLKSFVASFLSFFGVFAAFLLVIALDISSGGSGWAFFALLITFGPLFLSGVFLISLMIAAASIYLPLTSTANSAASNEPGTARVALYTVIIGLALLAGLLKFVGL